MCRPGEDPAICEDPGAWAAPAGTTTLTLDTPLHPSVSPSPAGTFVIQAIRARDPNPSNRTARGDVDITKFGCVYVYGSARYRAGVAEDLTRLYATTTGRHMLDCYWHAHEHRGHVIRIYPPARNPDGFAYNNAFCQPADSRTGDQSAEVGRRTWGSRSPYAVENGTGAHIYFNPACRSHYTGRPLFGMTTSEEEKDSMVVLCHELVHALHDAYAVNRECSHERDAVDQVNFPTTRSSGAEEEFAIVGEYTRIGPLSSLDGDSTWTTYLTENVLLEELHKPLRVEHGRTHRTLFRVATHNDDRPESEDDGEGWMETGPDLPSDGALASAPSGALGRRVAS